MRSVFLLFLSLVLLSGLQPASAADFSLPVKGTLSSQMFIPAGNESLEKGAENFISSMAQRGIGFLSNDGLSLDQKKSEFRSLLKSSFDMGTIGRFSLGRYWRVATAQEQKQYQSLFEEHIVNVYANRFGDYEGQNFDVDKARADKGKDVIVTSFIRAEGEPDIQIDWRVRYKDGRYKVVDVVVAGVSMAVTQRSDFSSVIQRGGGKVSVLLDHLKDN